MACKDSNRRCSTGVVRLEAEEPAQAAELDLARIQKEGFGPEAHGLDESDPNHATKMVT